MSTLVITASELHLRAGPGQANTSLGVLPRGTRVQRLGATDDGGWIYVQQPAGWMGAGYLAPAPAVLKPLSDKERQALFGTIEYVRAPKPGDAEAITITNGWQKDNIVACQIPQLVGIPGATKDGTVWLHRRAKAQFLALFAAWERAKLIDRIKSWDGAYNPRLVRGSTTSLSNHCYGSAFDINALTNGLGVKPPAIGQPGSVRELVPIARELGFFWGGDFSARADGMHFEISSLT